MINIQFRPAPNYAFPPEAAETWRPNRLTISIAPEMDIRLRFQSKRPGQYMSLNPVDMIFRYKDEYDGNEPEAYETLLLDVMEGNATLFMRKDQVEAAWKIIMPVLEAWQKTDRRSLFQTTLPAHGARRCGSVDSEGWSSVDSNVVDGVWLIVNGSDI